MNKLIFVIVTVLLLVGCGATSSQQDLPTAVPILFMDGSTSADEHDTVNVPDAISTPTYEPDDMEPQSDSSQAESSAMRAISEESESKPKELDGTILFEGRGPEVRTFQVLADGPFHFYSPHNGESNFMVQLLDDNGDLQDLIANCIGECSDESVVHLSPGVYYLETIADGSWVIAIKDLRP